MANDSSLGDTRISDGNRRRFLQTIGAVTIPGVLAGCTDDGDGDGGDTDTPTETGETDTPEDTDEPTDTDTPEPAVFLLSDLTISPESVEQGESVDIEATLRNDGGEDDGQLITLSIDGDELESELYQVDAGESTTVSFAETDTSEIDTGEDLEVVVASDDNEVTGSLTVEAANVFEVEDEPGVYTNVHHVDAGQVAGYQYMYEPDTDRYVSFKPFLDIWDPAEDERITHNPRFQDVQYAHHRGIFIGWDSIVAGGPNVDNWHEAPTVHQEYDPGLDTFEQTETLSSIVHWLTEDDGDRFATETREMRFREPPTATGIVTVDIRFTLDFEMETRIDGDPEHGGIQLRPHEDEDDRRQATYYFSDHFEWGESPGANAVNAETGYDWVAEEFRAHGNDYFVTHMNHPDNPYHDETTASAYRGYGRFGLYWDDKEYEPGDSVTFHYRWVVTRGGPPDGQASEIDEWFEEYADQVDL
jgi:hypothetical protein